MAQRPWALRIAAWTCLAFGMAAVLVAIGGLPQQAQAPLLAALTSLPGPMHDLLVREGILVPQPASTLLWLACVGSVCAACALQRRGDAPVPLRAPRTENAQTNCPRETINSTAL